MLSLSIVTSNRARLGLFITVPGTRQVLCQVSWSGALVGAQKSAPGAGRSAKDAAANITVTVQTRQHSPSELTLQRSWCYLFFTDEEIKSLRGRTCQVSIARDKRTLILNSLSSFVLSRSASHGAIPTTS